MSKLLETVSSELQRLPGIGRRTALRLAMHILKMEPQNVDSLAESITHFRHDIRYCRSCNNL
ncbi:MAG: recombination protein RecR, partial [Alistipes sp.]|nr:recombination protein RecR [Alistipes sp.]